MRRAVVAAAAVCALVAFLVSGALASHNGPGVKTAKQPFLVGTAPGVTVDPILSVGDVVPTGQTPAYQMSGIPDGLGAYKKKGHGRWHWFHTDRSDHTAVVVMNHELGRSFPNNPPGVDTRISRLEVDTKTHSVHRAEYLFTGLEGYERFCSSTLSVIRGRPLYFTGEEAIPQANQPPGPAHDGSSIVMDPETGMWRDTAHFGHFQHENVVPLKLKKWVFLSSEDDFRTPNIPSYLYAYIANDFNRALRGTEGSLHVWKADDAANNQNSAVTKGESVPGRFVPIPQSENTNSTQLKAASAARDAFRFDRLEDVAVRGGTQDGSSHVTYIADTGKPPATARGRVYEFTFNKNDPTRATLKMILNGDAPDNDDIFNPDNMDASDRVLMIQEDRESAFRDEPFSGGYGRVMEYRFSDGRLRSVARVNTPPGDPPNPENCTACRRGTWESSGIIDVGHIFGRDWWLLDVQAHNSTAPQPGPTLAPNTATGENGQLLLVRVPGSQGGGGDHDDDDDDD